MPGYLYHIIFAASFAFAFFGNRYDYTSSLDFVRNGQEEGNGLFSDEYDFFAPSRFIMVGVGAYALIVASYIGITLTEPGNWQLFPAFMFAFAGGYGWVMGQSNRRHARSNVEKQGDALDSDFAGWEMKPVNASHGGRWRYKLFPWVYVEPMPEGKTEKDIRPLIVAELRKLKESPRFSDQFYRPRRVTVE